MSTIQTYHMSNIRPLRDRVLVQDMEFAERVTRSGLILPSDDRKSSGIRPRWGKVYAVGEDQHDIKVGEYVLVSHGRWTRGVKVQLDDGEEMVVRMVDNNDILLVSSEPQLDETLSDAVDGLSDRHNIEGSMHTAY